MLCIPHAAITLPGMHGELSAHPETKGMHDLSVNAHSSETLQDILKVGELSAHQVTQQ